MSAPTNSRADSSAGAHAKRPGPVFDPDDPDSPLTDREVAEAYVASVCFKHGPPRLLGTELEWLVRDVADPTRPLDPAALARALGPHAPTRLLRQARTSAPGRAAEPDPRFEAPAAPPVAPAPRAPAPPAPLPAGCSVTVEPGGQVEIASPPLGTLSSLLDTVREDAATVRRRLADHGLDLVRRASDPLRPPRRILDVPRYAAMEAAFDRIGPHGRTMMCSTSAVQVCVDAGDGPEVAQRWAALHELGPVLIAAFANSPTVHGRRTGWKSSRMASWLALDPERTSPPGSVGADPAREWARRALDTRLLGVRRDTLWDVPEGTTFADWVGGALDDRPTRADLDYHLSTLFPPVRAHGHLEVRYLDQQAVDDWAIPVVVVAALLHDADTVDRARAAVSPARDRWTAAARHGLADRVLRRAAGELFEQVHRTLGGPGFADLAPTVRERLAYLTERRVLRGRCPADDPVGEPGEAELGPPDEGWLDEGWLDEGWLDEGWMDGGRPDENRPDGVAAPQPDAPYRRVAGGVSTVTVTRAETAEPTDEDAARLREQLAAALRSARARTRALSDVVDDDELTLQHSPLMSPLHWDIAHIANMEDFWLVRRVGAGPGVREDIDHLYDAFTNPRAGRPELPLLTPPEARAYGEAVRERALAALDGCGFTERRLVQDGFAFGMIAQHEQQHVETMLATHQLRVGDPVLRADPPPPAQVDGLVGLEVFHPGAQFAMGTDGEHATPMVWALDNERPVHPVQVEGFWLDAAPVTNAQYARFVDAGGYDDPQWWSAAGWEHISAEGWVAPMTWEKLDGAWHRTSFGVCEPVPPDQPVLHVCFHEAAAYAAWAGKRLPTEVEWELAARYDHASGRTRRWPWGDDDPTPERANLDQRHLTPAPVGAYPQGASPLGVHQLVGDVWEWCDSGFEGYPGFEPFPYKEYSEVFFGGDFKMLRGSSFGVGTVNARTTFRNWDLAIRRQIFTGFRCARSA